MAIGKVAISGEPPALRRVGLERVAAPRAEAVGEVKAFGHPGDHLVGEALLVRKERRPIPARLHELLRLDCVGWAPMLVEVLVHHAFRRPKVVRVRPSQPGHGVVARAQPNSSHWVPRVRVVPLADARAHLLHRGGAGLLRWRDFLGDRHPVARRHFDFAELVGRIARASRGGAVADVLDQGRRLEVIRVEVSLTERGG